MDAYLKICVKKSEEKIQSKLEGLTVISDEKKRKSDCHFSDRRKSRKNGFY